MEGLEERLSSATQNPATPAYRLSRMISEVTQMQVRPLECDASLDHDCAAAWWWKPPHPQFLSSVISKVKV